jgi:drug/metabolite transporter (DMT)-like permease
VTTAITTVLALLCFAANSLLCRRALAGAQIDAASFTAIRLLSGAVVLAALAGLRGGGVRRAGSWGSALALVAYAAPFSFAYLRLAAGTGALILFGAVQVTMIGWGIFRGERPRLAVWIGLAIAFAGLVALAAPGASAPDPLGAGSMAIAGVAWGAYSLRGRGATGDPTVATAGNFLWSLPVAVPVLGASLAITRVHASWTGIALAVASGGLASGLGYSLWYTALKGLTATRAAVLQLLVPVIAAFGGAALLAEELSLRLVLTGMAILCGVAIAIRARTKAARPLR